MKRASVTGRGRALSELADYDFRAKLGLVACEIKTTGGLEPMPTGWCAGFRSFADKWGVARGTLRAISINGRTLSAPAIAQKLEEDGFLVKRIREETTPDHAPLVSMWHGFHGLEPGLIESSLTIEFFEIVPRRRSKRKAGAR